MDFLSSMTSKEVSESPLQITKIESLTRWSESSNPNNNENTTNNVNNKTVNANVNANGNGNGNGVPEQVLKEQNLKNGSVQNEGDVKFTFNQEINKKIVYWSGDITTLDATIIVNSTNEAINEKNGVSEKLLAMGGEQLQKEIASLEGCKIGDAKITGSYSTNSRFFIHTVGPRFHAKYKTAAESALYNCYRMSLELMKENGASSIAFPVIHTAKRGFPHDMGAHIALRTVRRFLEHWSSGIDTVIFCVTEEVDKQNYEAFLPLYFPRSKEEAIAAITLLPSDIGNEFGQPEQEERKIRITDIPGQSTRLNASIVSEDNPLRGWDSAPEETLTDLAKMKGDHDLLRKEEITKTSPAEQVQQKYARLLRHARGEDFRDITSKKIFAQTGVDSLGRPIICVYGKNYNPDEINRDRVLLYLVQFMDSIASRDYVVVYFNSEATSDNHPDLQMIRDVYETLHPKYRSNLKILYLVHPTWWVKLILAVMNTFFTSDIGEKIKNVETLSQLYQTISPQQLVVPEYVKKYDIEEAGGTEINTTIGTSLAQHDEL